MVGEGWDESPAAADPWDGMIEKGSDGTEVELDPWDEKGKAVGEELGGYECGCIDPDPWDEKGQDGSVVGEEPGGFEGGCILPTRPSRYPTCLLA